jgi:hypothetical protein
MMSEAFWVAGAEYRFTPEDPKGAFVLQKAGAVLYECLSRAGIKPDWVDEIHWVFGFEVMPPANQSASVQNNPGFLPGFIWRPQDDLVHYLFHAIVRGILAEDLHLVCLCELDDRGVSVMCLASHTAVGRYNLNPCAGMAWRFALSLQMAGEQLDPWLDLKPRVQKSPIDPAAVACLAVVGAEGLAAENVDLAFPNAKRISREAESPAGIVSTVENLVHTLGKSRGQYGLLVSASKAGTILGTLFERI